MANKKIKLTWMCDYCEDVVNSYSYERHSMDTCSCGQSSVDLEEHYMRGSGSITEVSREEWYE